MANDATHDFPVPRSRNLPKERDKDKDVALTTGQRRLEIATVLAQHGWDVLLHQLLLVELLPSQLRSRIRKDLNVDELDEAGNENRPPLPIPSVLRSILVELGPTFVKLGQVLSTRADILPREYVEELEKLQQNVPPVPWPEMEEVILDQWNARQEALAGLSDGRAELATSVYQIFADFNPVPLAAGSLGQAYKAKIKVVVAGEDEPVEKDVIVKVQRPGVARIVEADLAVLRGFAKLITERSKWGKIYNFVQMVDDFAIVLRNELDFNEEATNTETIGGSLARNYPEDVITPRIYWDYTGAKMLTVEFIRGENISVLFPEPTLAHAPRAMDAGISALEQERKALARNFTNIFLHQIFIDGHFHADPHPGNVMVRLDREKGKIRICLIDFGMVGRVDPRSRDILIDFLLAMIQFDAQRATERILEFGKSPPNLDRHALTMELDHLLRQSLGRPIKEVSIGQVMQNVLELTLRFQVQLPSTFMTLVRVLMTIEGVCRQLDEDYQLINAAEPFVIKTLQNQFVSQLTFREVIRVGVDLRKIVGRLPRQIDDIFSHLNNGTLKTVHEHRGLERLERSVRTVGNRMSVGLVVAANLMAAAMVATSNARPQLLGMPILAWAFAGVGTILGLWLIRSISRYDRLS
ncbi:MAG: AarF/ABC1/UbiB kinase family protein [Candidatus Sericytochromatia bacterium]|nr:AarF/ABC1/UbiB kinase family protein [Candidatus Sericytochromatia bacterium]